MASITCGNCGATHPSVADVRICYQQDATFADDARTNATSANGQTFDFHDADGIDGFNGKDPEAKPDALPVRQEEPSTPKQRAYLEVLVNQRCNGLYPDHMSATGSKEQVSKWISELLAKAAPPRSAGRSRTNPDTADEPVDGIYIIRGEGAFYSKARIYKVYKLVHGSGRQGVKILHIEDDGEGNNSGTFHYLGLAVKHLPKDAERMGLEEAKTFGTLYGFCVRCGATLTDENSIADGIGPICAGKM